MLEDVFEHKKTYQNPTYYPVMLQPAVDSMRASLILPLQEEDGEINNYMDLGKEPEPIMHGSYLKKGLSSRIDYELEVIRKTLDITPTSPIVRIGIAMEIGYSIGSYLNWLEANLANGSYGRAILCAGVVGLGITTLASFYRHKPHWRSFRPW
jgi:hypothetical protein